MLNGSNNYEYMFFKKQASVRWVCISVLLMVVITSFSQTKCSTLNELHNQYEKSTTDTNKVRLLLQIDSLYLYRMPDTDIILDSALLMAQQARNLSMQLEFKQGYEDATFLTANAFAERNDVEKAISVANSEKGTLQVHILIMLAEHYIFKPGQLNENLNLAYPFAIRAKSLSEAIHSAFWIYKSVSALGKYYFANDNFIEGKKCFMQIIHHQQRLGDKNQEAFWWAELGRNMPHTHSTYTDAIYSLQESENLYRQTGNKTSRQEVLEDMAYLHQLNNDLDIAEAELVEAISIRKSIGRVRLYEIYTSLSEINGLKGNYNISLYYALEAVKNLETIGEETYGGGIVYSNLADAYKALGQAKKSIGYYRLALEKLGLNMNEYTFSICGQIVQGLLDEGNSAEALTFLKGFVSKNQPPRIIDKEIVAAALGDCYNAIKKYNDAETNYLQMIKLDGQAQVNMKKETQGERANKITGSEAFYKIGRFYVERGQYRVAGTYLNKAVHFNRFKPSLSRLGDIHGLLFKVDSAAGNYLSAIQHLSIQKQLNDSIFNERKSRQIEELQIQYETEKKEKDLQVFRSKEQLQDKELQKIDQAKNFIYILLIVLTVFSGVVYSRYRLKQKSNRQLQAKQEEINQKNISLQHLIKDKDDLIVEKDVLLEEKEWLLKEVHHRVKNNLQIVLSLLNTQSKYLDSEEAVDAIANSRRRMQAMSLVHQKLYENKEIGLVNMKTYIGELTDFLANSFSVGKTPFFDLQVTNVKLDIAQAIPIGLMLNEMITNSIKYAFSNNEKGVIFIGMKKSNDNNIVLEVTDNGKGFSNDVNATGNNSMGMRLIKGLVKQIGGKLLIKSEQGVSIRIEFPAEITT